jgi:hypothetical protein
MALEPDPPQTLPSGRSESEHDRADYLSCSDQEARSRTATAGAVSAAGDGRSPSDSPGGPGLPSSTFLNVVAEPTLVGGACVAPGGVAQPAELSADSRAGRTSSPRERASSAPSRTGQAEHGARLPPLPADPVRPAAVPAEVPPAAVPVGVARQQDGSGTPESSPPELDARPQTDVGARERDGSSPSTVEINGSLFDRVLAQGEQIRVLERATVEAFARADDAESNLDQVRETLDRLRVPTGALLWRLGWLEGRLGPETGR